MWQQTRDFDPARAGQTTLKQIPSAPNYFSDSQGNIYSNFQNRGGLRLIKITTDKHGYGVVSLHLGGGKRRQGRSHRLVAEAWIPNPENKPTVNHINEDKKDNRVENLEWATIKENNWHSKKQFYASKRGETHHATKLKEEDVKDIRMFVAAGIDTKAIARVYSIARGTVYKIARREVWGWL